MPPEVFYGGEIKLLYRYGFRLFTSSIPFVWYSSADHTVYNNCTKQTQYLNKLDNTLIIPYVRLKRVVRCA